MCCFSRPIQSVTATRIFARGYAFGTERERQFIIYSMRLKVAEELAMVLPIPVKPGTGENGVRFINLEGYPNFFEDMEQGFPERASWSFGCSAKSPVAARALVVLEVGSFEASYVPSVADFSRLDERFRLPKDSWEKLPQYKTYGFAVFKLKPGAKTIHPMAFCFPRASAKQLFFPTVHIHDGEVHPKADFDHLLYCQRARDEKFRLWSWRESPQLAKSFIDAAKAKNIVDPAQHCFRLELNGRLKNEDTVLD
jgi:hypothetical protein